VTEGHRVRSQDKSNDGRGNERHADVTTTIEPQSCCVRHSGGAHVVAVIKFVERCRNVNVRTARCQRPRLRFSKH
jgi:hypothetical protein